MDFYPFSHHFITRWIFTHFHIALHMKPPVLSLIGGFISFIWAICWFRLWQHLLTFDCLMRHVEQNIIVWNHWEKCKRHHSILWYLFWHFSVDLSSVLQVVYFWIGCTSFLFHFCYQAILLCRWWWKRFRVAHFNHCESG